MGVATWEESRGEEDEGVLLKEDDLSSKPSYAEAEYKKRTQKMIVSSYDPLHSLHAFQLVTCA